MVRSVKSVVTLYYPSDYETGKIRQLWNEAVDSSRDNSGRRMQGLRACQPSDNPISRRRVPLPSRHVVCKRERRCLSIGRHKQRMFSLNASCPWNLATLSFPCLAQFSLTGRSLSVPIQSQQTPCLPTRRTCHLGRFYQSDLVTSRSLKMRRDGGIVGGTDTDDAAPNDDD